MIRSNQSGSIVTLLCDGGERYADKYYNPDWLISQGLELEPYTTQLRSFLGHQG
jgi:cysteine synthase